MHFWIDFGGFALRSLWIAAMIAIVLVIPIIVGARAQRRREDEVKVTSLDERFDLMEAQIRGATGGAKGAKAFLKERRKAAKLKDDAARRVYLVVFKGDPMASGHTAFARKITAALMAARPGKDEIVVTIQSPGGLVSAYGLMAAQMQRVRRAGVELTACVDQVAASGGYMMAVVANRIVAAPFAVVGSIGVVAQVPNVNRLLKKIDVDYEEMTAGEYKRPISVLAPISDEGREHFKHKLEETHVAFKDFVRENRPTLNVETVGDGDYWYATDALKLGLIDAITTSDEYLMSQRGKARLFAIDAPERKTLAKVLFGRLGEAAAMARDLFSLSPFTGRGPG
ncbi:MAG TPA: protease SohB [Rhodoblastus sp.]|nr:protease SohB [Rhodoblastus sp.]